MTQKMYLKPKSKRVSINCAFTMHMYAMKVFRLFVFKSVIYSFRLQKLLVLRTKLKRSDLKDPSAVMLLSGDSKCFLSFEFRLIS